MYNNINLIFPRLKHYSCIGDVLIQSPNEYIQYFYGVLEDFDVLGIQDRYEFVIQNIKELGIQYGYEFVIQNVQELGIQYGENPLVEFALQGFFGFLYLFIFYIYYRYNHPKFTFLAFVISIVKQILLLFILTLSIYMVNNQDFLTIHDDKSLQYLCAFIGFILLIWLLVKKIQKDGLKKTLLNSFLGIFSVYLLRLNLIYYIPLILPLTLNQLALNVLTSRGNLLVYITEDILNLKIGSYVQSILLDSYKTIVKYCYYTFFYRDDHGRCNISSEQGQSQIENNLERLDQEDIKKKAIDCFNLEDEAKDRLERINLTTAELGILSYIRSLVEFPNLFTITSPRGSETLMPAKLSSVQFSLKGMYPQINPFPNSVRSDSNSYMIPLYKHITEQEYITEQDNIVKENLKHPHVVVIQHRYHDNYGTEIPMENIGDPTSTDIYVLDGYYSPPFIADGDKNRQIYIRTHHQYNWIYRTFEPKMANFKKQGQFCIRDGAYKKKDMIVLEDVVLDRKPTVIAELGYDNAHSLNTEYFSRSKFGFEQFEKDNLDSGRISKTSYRERIADLNRGNGTNDPHYNEGIIQSHKFIDIPSKTSAAEVNRIISSGRQ